MSLHTLLWLGLFLLLACQTFRRSSWGIPLYMLTYYALPQQWWWGRGHYFMWGTRWNLLAALIFAVGVLIDQRAKPREGHEFRGPLLQLLLLYALNASVVHYLFAANPEHSWEGLRLLWKLLGLLFLISMAIKDRFDLKLTIYAILMGSAFIGFEVVYNDMGRWIDGRLELLLGGQGGNAAAAILALSLPLAGYFVFYGNRLEKCVAVVSAVLTLETILRINSRGVILAIVVAALWFVVRAKGRARKYAILGIALGFLAAFIQMGESHQAQVLGRFGTIGAVFGEEEDRGASIQSRIKLWIPALKMIGDHPLGSGHGAAFESNLGQSYLQHVFKADIQKAVHNGFLDIAAGWGIQGFIIYMAAFHFVWRTLSTSISLARARRDEEAAFLGYCLEVALVLQCVASLTGSTLDGEWFFWLMGISVMHRIAMDDRIVAGDGSQEPDVHFTSGCAAL